VPPRWAIRLLEPRNSVSTRSSPARGRFCRLGDDRAHLQVFQHRHAREDAAALRRLRDAQPRDLVGRHRGDVVAVEQDLARAGARPAEDRHHQRRLAGAVGADQATIAGVDGEIDAFSASTLP
jgi:hypothetical protein